MFKKFLTGLFGGIPALTLMPIFSRLWVRILGGFVLAMLMAAISFGVVMSLLKQTDFPNKHRDPFAIAQTVTTTLLSGVDQISPEQFRSIADSFEVHLYLLDAQRRPLMQSHPENDRPVPKCGPKKRHRKMYGWKRRPICVPLVDGSERTLAVQVPKHHHRLWKQRFAGTVAAGMALVGILLITCYWMARRLTRRFEQVVEVSKQWSKGNMQHRIEHPDGPIELSEMVQQLNTMAGQVDQLIDAQKMMIANTSHELRSPLTRLQLACDLLANADPSRRASLLDEISQNVTELNTLIEQLLTSARIEALGANVLQNAEHIDLIHKLAEWKPEIAKFMAPNKSIWVNADPLLLQRAFVNLFENAMRYGGEVGFEIEVFDNAKANTITIVVRDHGPGIDAQDLPHIFDPFYRAQGHSEGQDGSVGLGLAFAKQIVEVHRGTLVVDTSYRDGAAFAIELPMSGH